MYLTQDGEYVNIWFGLLESVITESRLGLENETRFDIHEMYQESLFRGYVESNDIGEVILKSLRLKRYQPQCLSMSKEHGLVCSLID